MLGSCAAGTNELPSRLATPSACPLPFAATIISSNAALILGLAERGESVSASKFVVTIFDIRNVCV